MPSVMATLLAMIIILVTATVKEDASRTHISHTEEPPTLFEEQELLVLAAKHPIEWD